MKYLIGNGGPLDNLRGLWNYDQNWVVETALIIATYHPESNTNTESVTDQIFKNGVLFNEQDHFDEMFGFQTKHGRPFYFYKQDGKINISYDDQPVIVGYNTILHYGC